MVAQAGDPSALEAEARQVKSSRSVCVTQGVPGQAGLHSKLLSQKPKIITRVIFKFSRVVESHVTKHPRFGLVS